ncbi:MAG TPA: acyl-CoA dehydrogenase family protein [Acidisphaera sp.]|nr:acyl-CoA dehydrogenase family protein [Acidisphaera sp.]
MSRYAPRTKLATHEVENQPPEFADRNLFTLDPALRDAVLREGGAWLDAPLTALGEAVGSEQVLEWGDQANRYPPELISFDRWGRRVDEVRFHPSYHALMALAMEHRIHSIAWTAGRPGGHVAHAAMLALFTEAEAGVMCPVSMTYAAVPALRHAPALAEAWLPKIMHGTYDAPLRPIADKAGVTIGMAMTEKQGGSDVRANTTRAEPDGADGYRLTGHKWFCSAPMCDGFLTLAYLDDALTCFFVPRITPDGERNAMHVMRLKDKLGNRSNASSEIEYHGAFAHLVGEPGRGVRTIIEMVHHTRLSTTAGPLGIMRMALAQAAHHVSYRRAFQRRLMDQPAMRAVIADLALEYEANAMLVMRTAAAFDEATELDRAFARLATAVGKYWIAKRCPAFVYECLECLGGVGYIEETPMPRLYREAPLNAIWEGSGNVIALDILRTLAREPRSRDALAAEIKAAAGQHPAYDAAAAQLREDLSHAVPEAAARMVAERMALVLQASLLLRHAPNAISAAFCESRLAGNWGHLFGALPKDAPLDALIARTGFA